jgi:hypothetical protein
MPAVAMMGRHTQLAQEEEVTIVELTRLYEAPSPLFKNVGELKAGSRAKVMSKKRAWALMRAVEGDAQGWGLLPTAKRQSDAPEVERLSVSIKPSPMVVGLVTKGLGDSLRERRGGDTKAVERMMNLRPSPEEFESFLAVLKE